MARFGDWAACQQAQDIMERFLEAFPLVFEGFDTSKVKFILTKKKKSKEPIKVHAVGYPGYVWMTPYIVEVFDVWWKDMDPKRRNIAVWKAMCSIPNGGFDDSSKNYGKKLQPEIKMFMREYAACGGVPNWMDNPHALDPMARTVEEIQKDTPTANSAPGFELERVPVTPDDIAGV